MTRALVAAALLWPCVATAQVDRDLAMALRASLPSGARTHAVDAAGLSRSGLRLVSLEPVAPLPPTMRRLVVVGGLDGRQARWP